MFFQFNEIEEFRANNLLKKYQHDAGWDIRSGQDVYLSCGYYQKVKTGLHIIIPEGFYGIIQSRSGLGIDHGIEVSNAGVIDAGYIGEISLKVYNHSKRGFTIKKGDRIGQILFCHSLTVAPLELLDIFIPKVFPELEEALFHSIETDRGVSGFGSTGN